MRLDFSADDFQGLANHVTQAASQLPALQVELRARWRTAAADGYPTSSMGGHGRPSHELDPATGESVPLPNYSDRTGETATTEPTRDQDAQTLHNAWKLLQQADAALRSAQGLLTKALHPPEKLEDTKPEDPGCESCRRMRRPSDPDQRVWEVTYRESLCEWCWHWNQESGVWPAMDVLKDRKLYGKTITADRLPAKIDREAKILELHAQGRSLRQIGAEVGLAHTVVQRILARVVVPPLDDACTM